ncbi:MFS transporter [Phenylobacterium sp.]|jgi:predicted MFS family arabinose efflux permease|uniref:MFS transporter n=1 Tax=Phenylobacterium sp. TaxID=1871053 RepID=UPI0035B07D84
MAVQQSVDLAQETAPSQRSVDAPSAVVAAAYLIALNQLVANIQPLLLGALATDYGLSDRQLGHVSAFYVGAVTLCTLSAPLWIRRINWRLATLVSVAGCVAAFAWGATLNGVGMFLLLFAILGFAKGFFGAPAFASLGDGSNPDRGYGLSTVLQSLIAAGAAAPVASYIIPTYGVRGLFISLALVYATGIVAARWMPVGARSPRAASLSPAEPGEALLSWAAIPPLVAGFAVALFAGGILAFWYFVERIGVARGVPAQTIGLTISLAAFASILTSAINTWLGGRVPSLAFVAAGTALLLASYAVLLVPGDLAFVACNLLFALGWGFAQPAYWTIVRRVDHTGRLFVAAPAASGAAGVAIGIFAGPVIESGGYSGLIGLSSALIAAAILCIVGVLRFAAAR